MRNGPLLDSVHLGKSKLAWGDLGFGDGGEKATESEPKLGGLVEDAFVAWAPFRRSCDCLRVAQNFQQSRWEKQEGWTLVVAFSFDQPANLRHVIVDIIDVIIRVGGGGRYSLFDEHDLFVELKANVDGGGGFTENMGTPSSIFGWFLAQPLCGVDRWVAGHCCSAPSSPASFGYSNTGPCKVPHGSVVVAHLCSLHLVHFPLSDGFGVLFAQRLHLALFWETFCNVLPNVKHTTKELIAVVCGIGGSGTLAGAGVIVHSGGDGDHGESLSSEIAIIFSNLPKTTACTIDGIKVQIALGVGPKHLLPNISDGNVKRIE